MERLKPKSMDKIYEENKHLPWTEFIDSCVQPGFDGNMQQLLLRKRAEDKAKIAQLVEALDSKPI